MTDTAANPLETSAIVQRRLIGLLVLLFIAFLLSLLLRARPNAPDALPSVVIPLNTGTAAEASASAPVPTLDVPEPEPVVTPAAAAAPKPELRAAASAAAKPAATPKPVPPTAKPKPEKPAVTASKPAAAAAAPKTSGPPRWFVAVGSYKDPMAAKAIANRVKLAGFNVGTAPISVGAERLHRVRAGPFAARDEAESARVTLIVEGLTKAAIISEK
ncbi:MAG: SPOR domain-containing protein [Pseudomonadota bacterium]